jgi:hypothetical protein
VLKIVEEKGTTAAGGSKAGRQQPGGCRQEPWSRGLEGGIKWRAVFRDLESRKHLQVTDMLTQA